MLSWTLNVERMPGILARPDGEKQQISKAWPAISIHTF
jgi:hypothetical protein